MVNAVVGRRVASFAPERYLDGKPNYGEITDVLSDGRVMVKWDDAWKNKNNSPINPQKLCDEEDAKFKRSELEEAFSKVEALVKAELKKAGDIIRNASQIADEAGLDLQDMEDATSALEGAMESAGWNTSSWSC
jgi:hypothetical protein